MGSPVRFPFSRLAVLLLSSSVLERPDPSATPPGAPVFFNFPKPDSTYTPPERSSPTVYRPKPIPRNPFGVSKPWLWDPRLQHPHTQSTPSIESVNGPTWSAHRDPRLNAAIRITTIVEQPPLVPVSPPHTQSGVSSSGGEDASSPTAISNVLTDIPPSPELSQEQAEDVGENAPSADQNARPDTPPLPDVELMDTEDQDTGDHSAAPSTHPTNIPVPQAIPEQGDLREEIGGATEDIAPPACEQVRYDRQAEANAVISSFSDDAPASASHFPTTAVTTSSSTLSYPSSLKHILLSSSATSPSLADMSSALTPANSRVPGGKRTRANAATLGPAKLFTVVDAAKAVERQKTTGKLKAESPAQSSRSSARAKSDARKAEKRMMTETMFAHSRDYASAISKLSETDTLLDVTITTVPAVAAAGDISTAMAALRAPLRPTSVNLASDLAPKTTSKLKFRPQSANRPRSSNRTSREIPALPHTTSLTDVQPDTWARQTASVDTSPDGSPPTDITTQPPLRDDSADEPLRITPTPPSVGASILEPAIDKNTRPWAHPLRQPAENHAPAADHPAPNTAQPPATSPHDDESSRCSATDTIFTPVPETDWTRNEARHYDFAASSTSKEQSPDVECKRSFAAILIDTDDERDFEIIETPPTAMLKPSSPAQTSPVRVFAARSSSPNLLGDDSAVKSPHTTPLPPLSPHSQPREDSTLTEIPPIPTPDPSPDLRSEFDMDELEEEINVATGVGDGGNKRKHLAFSRPAAKRIRRTTNSMASSSKQTTAKQKTSQKRKTVPVKATAQIGKTLHLPSPTISPVASSVSRMEDNNPPIIDARETSAGPNGIFVNPSGIPIKFHVISLALRQMTELLLVRTSTLLKIRTDHVATDWRSLNGLESGPYDNTRHSTRCDRGRCLIQASQWRVAGRQGVG